MRPMTRQDHIDPLVIKVQKCEAPGCGPGSIQVLFQIAGYTKHEFPVWVCSSGHCSDYDNVPNLRKPEDDPVAWIQANARELSRVLDVKLCSEHEDQDPMGETWGMSGHIWLDGHYQIAKLCLPQAGSEEKPKKELHLLIEHDIDRFHAQATWACSCGETGTVIYSQDEPEAMVMRNLFAQHQTHRQEIANAE